MSDRALAWTFSTSGDAVATGHGQGRAQGRTDFELPSHRILGVSVGRPAAGLVERVERCLKMPGGLMIGVLAERPLAGQPSIPRRVPGVAAQLEVVSKRRGHLPRVFTPGLLQPLSHAPVEAYATGLGNLLVQPIAIESVSESVACGERAVRPLDRPARNDQLRVAHERFETQLDVLRVLLLTGAWPSSACCGCRKLDAHNARHFQKLPVLVGQSVQPALDEWAQSIGDLSEGRGINVHDPAAIASADGVRLDQVLEQVHHEQGIAIATLVDGGRNVLCVSPPIRALT